MIMTLEQKLQRGALIAKICRKIKDEAQRKRREHYNQLREKWGMI